MAGILYISTILLGFIFKKSKIVTALIFLSMIIFTVFCYENADLGSYSLDYDLDHFANDNSRYIGYDYLTHVALSLDIPFDGYRTIFYFFTAGLMIAAIRLLTSQANIVLSFILMSYFGIEAIQMKSFLADDIVLLAIAIYLHAEENAANRRYRDFMIPIGLFILAGTIHFSALFYLLTFLLFVFFKDTKKYSRYMLIFSLLAAGGMAAGGMASGGIIRILELISSFGLSSDQGMSYLLGWLDTTTRLGFLITYFVVFIIYLILFMERSYRKKHMALQITQNGISENLLAYIFTIGIMLPLLYVNVNFDRLFRVYFALIFIYFSRYPLNYRKLTYHELMLGGILFFLCIYEFFLDIYPFWEGTLGALLVNNLIFL
mgnify:CR=1 FL=1